jgi:hypothetical protein
VRHDQHRSVGVTTNVAERTARWNAIAGTIFFGVPAVLGPLNKYPNWAKHIPAVIAYLILVAAVLIVGCLRSWRMGLSMDNHGVTIRNYGSGGRWTRAGRSHGSRTSRPSGKDAAQAAISGSTRVRLAVIQTWPSWVLDWPHW